MTMNLQELMEELEMIAKANPELLEQPISCYFASKRMEFEIDRVYASTGDNTSETIINIS